MIVFEEEFIKTRGQPIQYKGKAVVMADDFPLPAEKTRLKYRILSTNSEWKQGIFLKTQGVLVFNGGEKVSNKWAAIWEHISPREDEFTCYSKSGLLEVKNVWDTGNGVVESWHNGAAMWMEQLPNGRRYHCNDGHPDDDFDDLIFKLLIV